MNTLNSPAGPRSARPRNTQALRMIQAVSRGVTLIFVAALAWAVYEAVVQKNPLPAWAWLGVVALLAVVIGLAVAAIVYRGVAAQAGPFDFRPSARAAGEIVNDSHRVEAGGATSLQAEISMTLGILELSGEAEGVLDGSFTYDDADWRPPQVEYSVDGEGRGQLKVEQKATGRPAMRQGRCEWALRLNRDLPTDLDVRCGAGKATLRLGGMSLTGLRVESGVGELDLDLSGEWEGSLQAFVKTGIGDATLRLPHEVGVRVQPAVGMGSIRPNGLTWDGQAYLNARYGETPASLEITVEAGMGKLSLL